MTKENYLFSKTHQWFDPETNKVGLTAYAAEQLGEISFVDLDGITDAELEQVKMDGNEPTSDPIDAVCESSKAVGDLYSPVSGNVTELNEDVVDEPEKINEDPFGAGWLFKVEPSNLDGEKGNLMNLSEYESFLSSL